MIKHGKLVGIVTIADIMNASPSQVTSLSIWEVNYLVSKITVKDVMTKDVVTVPEDMPIEDAARLMADTKIGGLPVIRGKEIVGMITETDLFKIMLEMMGARHIGVRASFLVPNQAGELAKVSKLVFKSGGNILSLGTFSGESPSNVLVTLKVEGIEPDALRSCWNRSCWRSRISAPANQSTKDNEAARRAALLCSSRKARSPAAQRSQSPAPGPSR